MCELCGETDTPVATNAASRSTTSAPAWRCCTAWAIQRDAATRQHASQVHVDGPADAAAAGAELRSSARTYDDAASVFRSGDAAIG